MTKKMLVLTAAMTIGLGQTFVGAQGNRQNRQNNTRFEGVDRNNDGRITRSEWNGSDQSFRQHDWNNDVILSGIRRRISMRRCSQMLRGVALSMTHTGKHDGGL